MSKKEIVLLFLLIGILLVSNANAKEDFQITAQDTVSLCKCSPQSYNLTIKNSGGVTSIYSVSLYSSNISWISPYNNEFTLKPGQKTNLPVAINAPCTLSVKNQNITLLISTKSGLNRLLRQKYEFRQCFDYSISKGDLIEDISAKSMSLNLHNGPYEICENQKEYIPLFFRNNDDYTNSYSLNIEGEKWVFPYGNEFSLGKRKSGALLLELNPPKDSEGNYNFVVKVISKLGEIKKEINVDVNVRKCHLLNLESVENDKMCSGDKKSYDVFAINNGASQEVVQFNIDAPNWVKAYDTIAILNSNSRSKFSLDVNPPVNASGNFDLNLTIKSKQSGYSASKLFRIIVTPKRDCYDGKIIASNSATNHYVSQYIPFKINNAGIRKADYYVEVDAPSWISVEPEVISLNPGQFWNKNIKLEPPQDLKEGDYDAVLKLKFEDVEYSKNIKIVVKKKNQVIVWIEQFYSHYRYYVYIVIAILIIIFLSREKIKEAVDRDYRLKKKRLKVLEKAREARKLKKKLI